MRKCRPELQLCGLNSSNIFPIYEELLVALELEDRQEKYRQSMLRLQRVSQDRLVHRVRPVSPVRKDHLASRVLQVLRETLETEVTKDPPE